MGQTSIFIKITLTTIFSFLLAGCLPTPSGVRRVSPESTPTPSASPTVYVDDLHINVGEIPFLQIGTTKTTSSLLLTKDFQDIILLRGNPVHRFLRIPTQQVQLCLIADFANLPTKKILILPAIVNSLYNTSNNSKEFLYQIESIESELNKAKCQVTSLTDLMNAEYPDYELVYTVDEVYPDGQATTQSTPLKLYLTTGEEHTDFSINHLSLIIQGMVDDNDDDALFCKTNSECLSLKYDCCLPSIGQCVKDKSIRPTVDQESDEFKEAYEIIKKNPQLIKDYQEFFYLCPQEVVPSPTPTTTTSDDDDFIRKKELYNCTIPQEGEMSICTVTYKDISSLTSATLSAVYATLKDDRNFKTTYMGNVAIPTHSITKVTYGEMNFYSRMENSSSAEVTFPTTSNNDTLTDPQKITIKADLPESASNDNLKISYQIDGSCIPINSVLYKCRKYYIQGQDEGKVTDHNPITALNRRYLLPYYADLNYDIVVKIDGLITQENTHWIRSSNISDPYIDFKEYDPILQKGIDIDDGQEVEITYFSTNSDVMQSKLLALQEIKSRCPCNDLNVCLLKPQYLNEKIIDYICDYPIPVNDALPILRDVSTKAIPLRYFDSSAIPYDTPLYGANSQEGKIFKYINKNLLQPNNVEMDNETGQMVYVGFNEIYGSIILNTPYSATPPVAVNLRANQQYDIQVDQIQGNYTPCFTCGYDYYTPTLSRFFPENFRFKGGGYTPSLRNKRVTTDLYLEGNYRSDDLLFGRACWLPATMIPWTHQKESSLESQRRKRMKAQHFLFANGYQRDWFGFDYGSLIGSFDGVTWFSVGNSRRVKSTSSKLYLAINGYFADLTQENSYRVIITKVMAAVQGSGGETETVSYSTTDFDSDGAECQKYHVCETDSDCITQLGWDYSCQPINEIKTSWPIFDENGQERVNGEKTVRIADILVGGLGKSSFAKRCVYRGRGAPCLANYSLSDSENSYAKTTAPGVNACLFNNYCQSFLDGEGEAVAHFNQRIARFGRPPAMQNGESSISEESDEFGLGARVIGRPYRYNGNEKIDSEVRDQLNYNSIYSLCIPGRDPSMANESFVDQHQTEPSENYLGDRVLGIGMSLKLNNDSSTEALSSCSIVDTNGNYVGLQTKYINYDLSDPFIKYLAGMQSYSTNLLSLFQIGQSDTILLSESTATLTQQSYQENRCIRSAGSPCFSDWDCAPNAFISEQVKGLGMSTDGKYNNYEYQFWIENLICGQLYPQSSQEYDVKKNRCCRAIGENITVGIKYDYTNEELVPINTTPTVIDTENLATIDIPGSDPTRYSRIAPAYYAMKTPKALDNKNIQIPALIAPLINQGITATSNGMTAPRHNATTVQERPQFTTVDKILANSCCGGHWIRHFHTENGGGHKWEAAKMQEIPKEVFKCLAFRPSSEIKKFQCEDPNFQCHAKNLDINEGAVFSDFLSSLELLGIPHVLIKSSDRNIPSREKVSCLTYVDPTTILEYEDDRGNARAMVDSATSQPIPDQPIPGTVRYISNSVENSSNLKEMWGIPEYKGTIDGLTIPYFSAHDINNFDTSKGLKMIFSSDTYSCCYPSGQAYNFALNGNQCCTGTAYQDEKNQVRCCLPDYTNVSIYLNRYVSSEASHLDATLFNSYTGTLPPDIVQRVALDKQLCCSGQTARGRAIEQNPIPGVPESEGSQLRTRFLYLENDPYANYYNLGQRWNTNIYCIPSQN